MAAPKYKILFVSSELYPLVKTGGLGDVSGSLPKALKSLHQDIRVLIPAYPSAVEKAASVKTVATINLPKAGFPGNMGFSSDIAQTPYATILETKLPGSHVKVWMVEFSIYNRSGGPYQDDQGNEWIDNEKRFALLNYIAVEIAMGYTSLNWHADIVHCNDWQTGLIAALLFEEKKQNNLLTRPATIFTIHNMAHMGIYSKGQFQALQLSPSLWNHHELEFHDDFSFIKGGLVFSDRVNAVSPTYAEEIQTEEFGYGMAGLLRHRSKRLSGIINGIDMKEWDPVNDPMIEQNYSPKNITDKYANKIALQNHFKLPLTRSDGKEILLLGLVARLVYQKGVDLLLEQMEAILELPVQIVILGSGDLELESRLKQWSLKHPEQLQIQIGYDEKLSHIIEAGADAFLMPSLFEPCGLNQLYSLRYGTIPIVRDTGGLADTVVNSSKRNIRNRTATGIIFHEANHITLFDAIHHTYELFQDKKTWKEIMLRGMKQEFSWRESAKQYLHLYEQAIEDRDDED
ncbi:MAG: glycogen synthase GlgA [Proteobacteria bacterium]|nr:glycogen synthase GlgA [Pseudomonadota bacterium]